VRRHPLTGRAILLLGGACVALVVVVGAFSRLSATPGGTTNVTIATAPGETLAYERPETTVHADGPITITFRNGSSLSHNLVFTAGLAAATRTIVEPGTSDEIRLSQTGPGTYPFACTIHDEMSGQLIVIGGTGAAPARDTGRSPS
jgi:plastocyanin